MGPTPIHIFCPRMLNNHGSDRAINTENCFCRPNRHLTYSSSEQDIPVGRGLLRFEDRAGLHRGPPTALWGFRSVGPPIRTRTAGMATKPPLAVGPS